MKVGLVLSGGGARCIAHLGMLKVLEENDVKVDYISGASAGSIAGALYSYGYTPDEILDIILNTNFMKFLKPAFNWRSLLKLESAAPFLREILPEDSFESLKIPLTIAMTNLHKAKVKYVSKGPLVKPIIASCSIPVVFDPVTIKDTQYIDGGILDNLPVKPAKKNTDFVIAFHANPIAGDYKMSNWRDLMERSLLMAISSATYLKKKKCDIFWEPPELQAFKVFDFKKAKDLYEIGYNYGLERVEKGDLTPLMSQNEKA